MMRPQMMVLILFGSPSLWAQTLELHTVETQVDVAQAWKQATTLEAEGRFVDAARALLPVAEQYPQEFSVQLQLGWLYFQAEDYSRARKHYGIADGLAEEPGLARLGLGWTAYRTGDLTEARRAFEAFVKAHPDQPSTAVEGLALVTASENRIRAEDAWRVTFNTLPVMVQTYLDHPEKAGAYGAGIGVTFEQGGFWLNSSYAYTRYELRPGVSTNSGMLQLAQQSGSGSGGGTRARNNTGGTGTDTGTATGAGNQAGKAFGEHAGFVGVGYGGKTLGLTLYGTYLENDGAIHGVVSAGGATLRLSFWNDLYLGGTMARINNQDGVDGRVSIDVSLGRGWWLTPGGVVHKWDDRPLMGSGKLAISRRSGVLRGHVSGRYGRSYHEVDFVQSTVASHADDLVWGGTAGVSIWPTQHWSVGGFVSAEGYERTGEPASMGLFGGVLMTIALTGD